MYTRTCFPSQDLFGPRLLSGIKEELGDVEAFLELFTRWEEIKSLSRKATQDASQWHTPHGPTSSKSHDRKIAVRSPIDFHVGAIGSSVRSAFRSQTEHCFETNFLHEGFSGSSNVGKSPSEVARSKTIGLQEVCGGERWQKTLCIRVGKAFLNC